MRWALLPAAIAGLLAMPGSAPAATPSPTATTGSLLVILRAPGAGRAQAAAARSIAARTGARPTG
ncbi:MAG: hypothetical protein QOF86_2125, partial [Baekduia sp.]|nr:hypothetical protein [Baekduia sp.]